MPDAFHSRSRLVEVPEVVVASEPPGEVLTLGQVICHAPGDVNRENEGLIDFAGGQLLNQLDDVCDRGRDLVNAWVWIAQRGVKVEKGALFEQVPDPASGVVAEERGIQVGVTAHQWRELRA